MMLLHGRVEFPGKAEYVCAVKLFRVEIAITGKSMEEEEVFWL